MPIGILNNVTALAAENNLSITNNSLQKTLLQLSSGDRINSGADDAAGLAIANGLEANVTALTQSEQNVSDGTGELQVADGALSQVTTLLNRAITLATESATGTVSNTQRVALQSEFSQITQEIDQIGQNTTFNGAPIFSSGSANYNQITSAANSGASLGTAVTGTLTIQSSGGTAIYTTSTADTTVSAMISDIDNSGKGLVASLNSTGQLMITDTQNRGSSAANQLTVGTAGGFEINAATQAFSTPQDTNTTTIFLSDSTAAGVETIGVQLGAFSSNNMNGISLAADNLSTAASAQNALTDINNAISQVAGLRGQIGGVTERLQSAANVISSQTQNLTSAEDTIMEADIPTAVGNLTNYSILEQTGISALAQANQQQQLVLKLLQ
jgi:flagellin